MNGPGGVVYQKVGMARQILWRASRALLFRTPLYKFLDPPLSVTWTNVDPFNDTWPTAFIDTIFELTLIP